MGRVDVSIGVGNRNGGVKMTLQAMVDTGAAHTQIPAYLLTLLGIIPTGEEPFELADSSQVWYPVGEASIFYEGKRMTCKVIFGEGGEPLIGATTLENFGLMVDPVGEQLVSRNYIMHSHPS